MTVVAAFDVDNGPILIGDLLLSSTNDGISPAPLNVPTASDVNKYVSGSSGRIVTGLKQKVIMINDAFAVAWGGRLRTARTVIRDIEELIDEKGQLSIAELLTFLNNVDYLMGEPLYLTGIMIDRRDCVKVDLFSWDSQNGRLSRVFRRTPFGDVYMGGSGADDLKNLMSKLNVKENDQALTPIQKAHLTALTIVGTITGQQLRWGQGFDAFYGGGFEIVTFNNGKLQKMNDVTYYMWDVMLSPDGLQVTTRGVLNYRYDNRTLFIRRLDMGRMGSDPDPLIKEEIYIVVPVQTSLTQKDKDDLASSVKFFSPIGSNLSIFNMHIPQIEKGNNILCHAHYAGESPVRYIPQGKGMIMEVEGEFINLISDSVSRMIKTQNP